MRPNMRSEPRKQEWESTKIPNLFKLGGVYYGRLKRKGKSLRKSFQTTNFVVARGALRDWMISLDAVKPQKDGTLGGMIEMYQGWLAGQKILGKVTDSTIAYKMELVDAIRNTWTDFDKFKLELLTADRLRSWQIAHHTRYSATRTNGAITSIREIIALATTKNLLSQEVATNALPGLQFTKVSYDYKRLTLQLPSPEKLLELRNEVYRRCQVRGSFGGWLFDFILFSGCRIDSAQHVLWEDVTWGNEEATVYFRKAKYGTYSIPLFPQLRTLLERIKKAKSDTKQDDRVLPTKSLQSVLTAACKQVGCSHLSHHDLRHIFATRCIEAGKDIPLVASWLGHKDGGRTAMMVYGHLRQKHSQEQAATMDFLPGATI